MTYFFEQTVLPEWLDFNQHMRDAYYGLVFSMAIDAFMDEVGLDEAYRARTKGTIYVVEDHRFYLLEVKAGTKLRVRSSIIDADAKRIHLWQGLEAEGETTAVCESMLLHVSQDGAPHVTAMPTAVFQTVQSVQLSDAEMEALPKRAGQISIGRKGKKKA